MITIMDIAELWPDYLYPSWIFIFYFWPIRAHSMHPPSCYGITHTRGKIKLQEFTMKRSVVVAW